MKSKMNIKSIIIMAIISLASMLFINISFAANNGVVNVEVANLRQEANTDSTILEHIQLNEEVEILEEQGEWYKVKYKKITGYVNKELVTVSTQENVIVSTAQNNINNVVENNTTNENTVNNSQTESSQVENNNQEENGLNIELGEYKIAESTNLKLIPSINATDVLELKVDETVNVVEIINGWVCIKTETATGWIRQEKLKKEEPKEEIQAPTLKTKYVSATSVNVRAEANTNSSVVTTITLNTKVEVSLEENGWSKVKVNNKEGYILSSLLSNTQTQTSRSLNTSRTSQTTSTTNANTNNNTNNNKQTTTQAQTSTQNTSSSNGSAIVATAKKYLGYRYVYGGASPSTGFDCSGFTSYVYKQYGISLNRTAAGQYSNGVAVSRANLQPGDLVMFGKSGINHVAIYIGGGQIIHASTPATGVRIDSLSTSYYNRNYAGARRII